MGRFTKNAVAGKLDEARSGWRARQEKARLRSSNNKLNRAEIAAARAAHLRAAQAEHERGFNPEVSGAAGDDYVSSLSDADLLALYRQLHDGRSPHGKAKRPAVEKAVRAKQAERAAQAAAADAENPPEDDIGQDETQ